jgi:putative ABC transport system permease protein
MLQILIYGFITVISLISSVNIINTITTNIILRKREFAALKSIGLTQKGLKKMIVIEGILYAVVGTAYGSVIGSGLSYLMYRGLSDVREFGWNIPFGAIAISLVASLVIGYLSVLSPLSRIKKSNLIEAIREE